MQNAEKPRIQENAKENGRNGEQQMKDKASLQVWDLLNNP